MSIVQNRPTQFDLPLYARMHESDEWGLQVIYTETEEKEATDRELGRSPQWDHVPREADRGLYLSAAERRGLGGLVKRIVSHRPALVVLCGYYPRLHARLVGPLKRRGLKIGLRSDNTLPHGDFTGLKGIAKRTLLPFWLARYDTWHPVGSLAQTYLERMSRQPRPVFPFPYAVDVDWFERRSAETRQRRDEARKRLGMSLDDFVILGIMKWHRREDPLTLLRAFAQVHGTIPHARLLLVGDGPLRDEVRAQAERLGDAIIMPGYQPYSKLPGLYAVSDVFVHPSVDEPWGVSVQEAQACGLPVVVAEGVGARFDLLDEGVNGWSFPNGDDRTLAEQLGRLAHDDDLRRGMASAAPAAARRMDYGHTLSQFRAAVEEVGHSR